MQSDEVRNRVSEEVDRYVLLERLVHNTDDADERLLLDFMVHGIRAKRAEGKRLERRNWDRFPGNWEMKAFIELAAAPIFDWWIGPDAVNNADVVNGIVRNSHVLILGATDYPSAFVTLANVAGTMATDIMHTAAIYVPYMSASHPLLTLAIGHLATAVAGRARNAAVRGGGDATHARVLGAMTDALGALRMLASVVEARIPSDRVHIPEP